MSPQELQQRISTGLLSFPLTDFEANGDFCPGRYAERLEWLMPYGATALFAAGGTGEFFSLEPREYSKIISTAVARCQTRVPLIAGVGGSTRLACDYAREAEKLGADGLLLLPHYLTEASQQGIAEYVKCVCHAVRCGVIVYNRGSSRLTAATLEGLAESCPNLIGFKDGVGDIEQMTTIRRRCGARFAYLGGLPTAEVYAPAYKAMGVPVYSSAVFNFIPRTAMRFYHAVATGDVAVQNELLDAFFLPYLEIRNRQPGYAVSIVKAGARLAGRSAGPVRPPLVDLQADETERLRQLMAVLGPQE